MINNDRKYKLLLFGLFSFFIVSAQEKDKAGKLFLTGSLQSDILVPQTDESIGAESYSEWALNNTYLDLNLLSKNLEAGVRFEYLEHPLPGYEADFAGWGLPHFYLTGNFKTFKLTFGDFYDQFGSGFIFRTYEERSLGIDNALRGGRIAIQPFNGLRLKLLGGKQRRYFAFNDSYVWGGDAEMDFTQWSSWLQKTKTNFSLETSFSSRHEADEWIEITGEGKRLNLPRNVGAFDLCTRLQHGKYSFIGEWAEKGNDPSNDNGYIYKKGTALLLSGSYSQKGLSALLQAKRSDNMSFRSIRSGSGTSSFINHLPAFAMQQTYALAALYPYATQPGGEWAFQGEFSYNFQKNTTLGGKYGTNLKLNISHIRSIDKHEMSNDSTSLMGTDGYTSSFFKLGNECYYQDINLNLEKKISNELKINLMYMNQYYNKFVIEKHIEEGEAKIVKSNIFVAESKYKISRLFTLRSELQYLETKQDKGDWMFALAELSVAPAYMFTVSDMYNAGKTDLHYYNASGCFTWKSHRIQVGYGRTRAGYNCSGGVCRFVPASKGFQLSYNYNF
jgi:hypothetical protein